MITVGDRKYTVDKVMAGYVNHTATDAMNVSTAPGTLRESEQLVYFGEYLGVPDEEAFGTCDFSWADFEGEELGLLDKKYGMGVTVYAKRNRQMMRYGLGVLNKYGLIADFKRVKMIVHQPRLDHVDEWTCTVDDLLAYAEDAKAIIAIINGAPWSKEDWPTEFSSATGPIVPGEKQCKFCKAKAFSEDGSGRICPALRAEANAVATTVANVDDFTDLTEIPSLARVSADQLGLAMDKVWVLEEMAKAVRAEVERRLLAGEPVSSPQGGYKLGPGKKGNRKWIDEEAVIKLLKSFRLKQEEMFDFELKGIPHFEKLLKKDSPTRWNKLAKLYGQSEGKPSVMRMDDPRPAITKTAVLDSFDDLTGAEDLL